MRALWNPATRPCVFDHGAPHSHEEPPRPTVAREKLEGRVGDAAREHKAIGAAARRLEAVAREERKSDVEKLAQKLQLHARSEEELFYPAALLVGDVVKGRK